MEGRGGMGGSGPLNAAMPVAPAAGRARVRAFGLTWEESEDMLRRLGFTVRLEIMAA